MTEAASRSFSARMRLLAYWLPAVAYMAAIFWASSRSRGVGPQLGNWDKLAHFGAYAVLGWLLWRAADSSRLPALSAWPSLWAVLLGAAYGASDEVHQMSVPGRSAEVADLAADVLGLVAAQGVIVAWRRRRAQ